ncbi:MAG TPA: ABC transporter ATP-binding protein/permease [Candidatus Dietzia intestinigallinarum]|nr:ABC transporter ATP-binding protein/permease [Candidatus Dietzia intestinigallinarum]
MTGSTQVNLANDTAAEQRTIMPVATARESLAWLASECRNRWGELLRTTFVGLLAAGSSVTPVYLLGTLIDEVMGDSRPERVLPLAITIVVAALVSGVLVGLSGHLIGRLGERLLADLREQVLDHALQLPSAHVEEAGRGDLLSRVGADVSAIGSAIALVLPSSFNAVMLAGFSLVGLVALDWRLGLAGAVAIPFYYLAVRWYLPRSAPLYAEERVVIAERSHVLMESVQGLHTVRAYEIERDRLDRIDAASRRSRDLSLMVFAIFTRFIGRINRAEFAGLATILVVAFVLVRADLTTVGAASAAALLFHRLFGPVSIMLFTFDDVQTATASLRRLVGVLRVDLPRAPAPVDGGRTPTDSRIEVEDVRYSYRRGGEVLRGVTLTLAPGSRTVVVGATGAGKSTLAAVVAGRLSPSDGMVRLGGVPLADLSDDERRSRIATVTQEFHVFSGTVLDDLRMAAPDADRERVSAALALVGADSWVSALPDGLDTVVGEQANVLTPAQAQHLALARLALADPDVVILDEATAEAGTTRSRELDAAAEAAVDGRTALVIAHRLKQVTTADTVVVMEDGRIAGHGTHEELLAGNERYRELWSAWNSDGLEDHR